MTMEATFFLNHLSTLLVYKLYDRVTNAGAKWQMASVQKMSRKTMNTIRLQPPKVVI